jgi:hypothetical protein
LKEELAAFPFVDMTALTSAQKQQVSGLSRRLLFDQGKPWDEIDALVFELYGLSSHDVGVVRDTIRFGSPYRSAREPAVRPPQQSDCNRFCRYLEEMLQPFVQSAEERLRVETINAVGTWNAPWRFITLTSNGASVQASTALLSELMRQANRTGASRVIVVLPQGGLLIGLLNQLRFSSQSRARLCGLHIVRQHLGAFRRK